MAKIYKLTTLEGKTYNQTQWGENVTHATPTRDTYRLCSPEVLHAYVSPEMAVLMDPVQAALLPDAILWECEGDVVINDGTKVGCASITTLRQVPLPAISPEQRVTFAIRCVMLVFRNAAWTTWARAWLDGTCRADATAANAAYAAVAARADAADAAVYAAVYAARAAAVYAAAVYAAADYAAAEAADYAADAAVYAAEAADYAARAAEAAAKAAAARAADYAAKAAAAAEAAADYADAAEAAAADAAAHAAKAAAAAGFIVQIASEVCK